MAETTGLVKLGNLFDGPAADMPVAGWITTKEYAEANPEIISGLQQALSASVEELSGNRERLVELVPTFTTVTEDTVQAIELPEFSAELNLEQLQKGADLMYEFSLVDEELDVAGTIYSP